MLGTVFLLLALSLTDETRVIERLGALDLQGALLVLCASIASIVVRGLRWRGLLSPMVTLGASEVMAAYAIANTTNMLAPARLGDLVRARLVARGRSRTATVLASVAVERFLDLSILTILLWVASIALREDRYRFLGIALAVGVTLVFLAGAWISLRLGPTQQESGSTPSGRILHHLFEHGRQFTEGLRSVSAGRRIWILGAAWSSLAWAASILAVGAALQVADIAVPIAAVILVEALFELAGALPSAPAFIGTIQAASIAALVPFGIPADAAVAFSLLYQAAFVSASVLMGAVGLSTIFVIRRTRDGKG